MERERRNLRRRMKTKSHRGRRLQEHRSSTGAGAANASRNIAAIDSVPLFFVVVAESLDAESLNIALILKRLQL